MISRKTAFRAALVGSITVTVVSIPAICSWWCDHTSCSSDRTPSVERVTEQRAAVMPAKNTVRKAASSADAETSAASRARALRAKVETSAPLQRPDYRKITVTIPSRNDDPEDN